MVRHHEQTVEPGDGARSDHVKLACYPFSGRGFDNHVLEVQIMHRAAQEFGAESARLDKRNGIAGHAGDNKAGKARPGADVDPATAARRESDQLRRIKNVTVPETIESRGRNEICREFSLAIKALSPLSRSRVSRETWANGSFTRPESGGSLQHTARRARLE